MESPTTYEHSDAMVPDQKNAFVFTGNIRVKLVRRLGFISSSRHCLRKRVRFLLIMSFLILTLLLVIGVRSPNVNSPPDRQSAELSLSRRLPLDVKPTNYKIKLTPYLDEEDLERLFTFDGEVYILVTCRQMTDTVTLHAASLSVDIESIQVTDMNGDVNMGVVATNIVSQFDFFVINLKHSLQVGRQYIMYMKYSGNMTTDNRWLGFIASYSGTRYIASTHLEPTYARSVFPCFDEPSLKATFDITVKHRLGRSALSNMPNIKNHTQGEWNTAYFNTTVVMSTYLVAVVVSDFECKEAVSEGVQFRVWSAKDDLKDTQFALEIGMQFLSYFEDLWYIPYPLPKLDMVIIDIDGSGAMENWGLITFNSPMVLYNKVNDSLSQQVTVAMTVVHELTHMWFGNIVTLDWWDDTWLKEGFADFFQFWGVDHLKPGWHVYEEFYQDRITFQAFLADMDPDSQSIVAPAGKYRPPVEQFATTSYKKGAAMVMMMQTFLGEETFYEGVRNYLMRHLYGSVKRTDLWACLTEADIGKGDTDFRSLMEPWLLYPGYPLVTILRQGSVITVEQEQFLIQPLKKISNWSIPLTYYHSGNVNGSPAKRIWFTGHTGSLVICLFNSRIDSIRILRDPDINKPKATFNLTGVSESDWTLFNINQTGYYRVNYDTDNWYKLINQLQYDHRVISCQNRAALVSDVLATTQSQHVRADLSLQLMEYLVNETDYSPWVALQSSVSYIDRMLGRTPVYERFQNFIQSLIKPMYYKFGWNVSSIQNIVNYKKALLAIQLSCYYGNSNCIKIARRKFHDWLSTSTRLNKDVSDTILCTGLIHSSERDWVAALAVLLKSNNNRLSVNSRKSLACSRLPVVLQRYMEQSTHAGDFADIIGDVRDSSPMGFQIAWNYTLENFDTLSKIDKASTYDLLWKFVNHMNSDKDLDNYKNLRRYITKDMTDDYYKQYAVINGNKDWMKMNYQDVADFLKNKIPSVT